MISKLCYNLFIIFIWISGLFCISYAQAQIVIAPISNDVEITLDSTGNKVLAIGDLAHISGISGSATITMTPSSVSCAQIGLQQIDIRVQDGVNSAETSIMVKVKEQLKILYPVGLLKIPTYGNCVGLLPDFSRFAKVNTSCGDQVTVTQSLPPGTEVTLYLNDTIFVMLRAQDQHGNQDSVLVKALGDKTVPLPIISVSSTDTAICSGNTATFTKTITGLDYAYGNWQLNGNDIKNAYQQNITLSDLKDGDKISYIIPTSCSGNVSSNIINIKVYPDKIPDVKILSIDTVSCPGILLRYKPVLSVNIQGVTYKWILNGKITTITDSVFQSASLKNGDILTCKIFGSSPCLGPFAYDSNNYIVKINSVISPSIVISSVNSQVCTGSPISFDAVLNNALKPTLTWRINGSETGNHGKTFSAILKNGDKVDCILDSPQSCSPAVLSNQITATVAELPIISLPNSFSIAAGKNVIISPVITGNVSTYQWSPNSGLDNAYVKAPLASPDKTTVYTLTVVSLDGCAAVASVTVNVTSPLLVIPNTFTPNSDGVNDTWHIPGILFYPNCRITIYNRYGQSVFFSTGYYSDWNGTCKGSLLPVGTYYYVIELNPSDQSTTLTGSVTIIR
ncbi:gliding motility-associated C-terminal domain-containing protein [Mucilaginibacter jinjuensis]|uniref:Gliding motility-associated C-terminal domain-containing protein n=1 Tax=Mucilaginibacter jinjuensis TaxID=1176721 RepID=A0ABY7TET9_9SPHI|nr:gliding motility-associated C-terminal domain-containing protein [Mucilaginibacter jinjuensis]WCT14243.1 gliding motility-associated C-terminal domain-containing protein [Mucilaginibacter jinjuensis]